MIAPWNISIPQPGRKLKPSSYTSWRSEFFEQTVVLGEAYREEQVNRPALKAGRFRSTLSESVASSMRQTSLDRPALSISKP